MTAATITDNTTTGDPHVLIQWNNSTKAADWRSWRIYARPAESSQWRMLYETFADVANYDYKLYQFVSGNAAEYSVVQVTQAVGFPAMVELFTDATAVTTQTDGHFWLIDPLAPANNLRLESVTGYPTTLEIEEASYHIIGRGRKVDRGDRLGERGTMSGQFRWINGLSPRAQRFAIRDLVELNTSLFLRSPLGETYQVQLSNFRFTPLPGDQELGDWQVEVIEVGGAPLGAG